MKKEELRAFAKLGMPKKIREVEEMLAEWHAEFPDLFLTPDAPQLLRPELRNGSFNGAYGWGGKRTADPATDARREPRKKKTKSTSGTISKAVRAGREHSAALLAAVAEHDGPMTPEEIKALNLPGFSMRAIGPLVRRQYLRHTSKGYSRTSKEFSIERR